MMDHPKLIDASTLTPAQRRDLMPDCAKLLEDLKKAKFTFTEITFVENGYIFTWRKPK